jgi:asparagine synthase (glutamine-hydrolysing)
MPQDVMFARKLAQSIGIKLHEIEVVPDIAQWLPRMVSTLEEPVSDPATLNVMLMCEAARKAGAKVLLSGAGADELFGGYRRHRALIMATYYRQLPVAAFGRGITSVRWAKRYLAFADKRSEADAYLRSYSYYDCDSLCDLASGLDMRTGDAIVATHRKVFEQLDDADLPTRMSFTDLHYFLPALNLTYTDRASMYASTEVRVPFVDKEVARAAFSLPGTRKATAFGSKLALKEAAERWLPREIIHRPKASFGVPLRAWMHKAFKGDMSVLAHEGKLVRQGYVSSRAVKTMIADFQANRADYSYQLWHLLVLEHWLAWVEEMSTQRVGSTQ